MRGIIIFAFAFLSVTGSAFAHAGREPAGEQVTVTDANSRLAPQIAHIGFVVADAEGAARRAMQELGLPRSSLIISTVYPVTNARFAGGIASYTVDLRIVETGNAQLEYIQPLEGRSPYSDALAARGGDVAHHVAYIVPSIDAQLARARARGLNLTIVVDAPIGDRGRFVYVDGILPGILVELIEMRPVAPGN